MIVSLSKKHSKGIEKPVGKATKSTDNNVLTTPDAKGFLFLRWGKRLFITTLIEYYGGLFLYDHVTTENGHTKFQQESPGTVVTLTQL